MVIKKTIVCFGDSNTHGYNAGNGGRFDDTRRWPCLLQQYLGDAYLVREDGMCGRTVCLEDPLFEGLNGLTTLFTTLMAQEPVYSLIIMLGTNDTKARFSLSAENIAKGLHRLAEKAIATGDAWLDRIPRILLTAPPPIADTYVSSPVFGEMGAGCAEKSRQLAAHYRNTAGLLSQSFPHAEIIFFDAGSIPGIQMHPADSMHLDEQSHRLLAKAMAGQILSYSEML